MKDHHKDKAHPKPKGGGMPYFEKEHWQKDVNDVELSDGRYSSQMNQLEEYTEMVNKQAKFMKNHKAQH